ncbi:MAG: ABC transporter ATP-binding protein [Clostridiales bacterium]|nr:ABC transporter ATP-binding protein [Clostridiales bacterium]
MIQLSEAKKIYGTGESTVHALSGITLTIQKGEFVAITGKSGCGKTTLLNIIGLLDNLTEGHYTLNGQDVRHLSDKAKARLRFQTFGYIFQSFNLLSSHTVAENVALPLGYAGVPKQERLARAAEMLRKVGLLDKMKAYPNELSGGQQQRVAIARALINHPPIILADEPTGNLDSRSSAQIMDILAELADEGATLLLVTHDAGVARRAGRRVRMENGGISEEG